MALFGAVFLSLVLTLPLRTGQPVAIERYQNIGNKVHGSIAWLWTFLHQYLRTRSSLCASLGAEYTVMLVWLPPDDNWRIMRFFRCRNHTRLRTERCINNDQQGFFYGSKKSSYRQKYVLEGRRTRQRRRKNSEWRNCACRIAWAATLICLLVQRCIESRFHYWQNLFARAGSSRKSEQWNCKIGVVWKMKHHLLAA